MTISTPNPIQRAAVGDQLVIQCIVNTEETFDANLVAISWVGPGGDISTNDSRVTINPTIYGRNNYTSSLQFTYLMEGDEGTYICDVTILTVNGSESVILEALTSKSCMHNHNIFTFYSLLKLLLPM